MAAADPKRTVAQDESMFRFLAIFLSLFLSGEVFGKTFDCREVFAAVFSELSVEDAPVLVVATINADGKTGAIEVADTKFEAKYQVEGLDRTWRFFTEDDQEYGYLFLIQPDGTAAYYDFETSNGEPTLSNQVYSCRERQGRTERQRAEDTQGAEIDRQRAKNEQLRFKAEAAPEAELDVERNRLDTMHADAKAAYVYAIEQRIQSRWVAPPTATDGIECIVNIRQLPGGEVVSVSIGRCNGDSAVRRSIETAVYRSSPLPNPRDPSVFERDIDLEFRPQD